MLALRLQVLVTASVLFLSDSIMAGLVSTSPSLTLTYKNYHWRQSNTERKPSRYRDEWVHGLIADFDSGYFNGLAGAEITAGNVIPLDVNESLIPSNLARDENGKIPGIAGIQQAFIKGRYKAGAITFEGKYGVRRRRYQLYSNASSRVLRASSLGLDLAAYYRNGQLYGAYITGASNYNDDAFHHGFTNSSKVYNQSIEAISILGLNYVVNKTSLTVETLRSTDSMAKYFTKIEHSWPLGKRTSLAVDARFSFAHSIGDKLGYDIDSDGDGKKDHFQPLDTYRSHFYNVNITLEGEHGYLGLGYNQTFDGDWISSDVIQGNSGKFNSSLSLWGKYSLKGEKAGVVRFGYNFVSLGLSGLELGGYIAYGWGARNYRSYFQRKEWELKLSYDFSGPLEGLSISARHANYWLDGQHRNIPGDKIKVRDRIDRFYLTYTWSLF